VIQQFLPVRIESGAAESGGHGVRVVQF
jgi:hypothetical protein